MATTEPLNDHPTAVAVLIPCLNEEAAIGDVVTGFATHLQNATVYVYDNGSTDRTIEVARSAGAVVRSEPLRGKGNVVRRMFADIDADVYVLVDGDGTYDPAAAPELVQRLTADHLDMVNGARTATVVEAYRPGHRIGNSVLTGLVARIFGHGVNDLLSGYRAFSRRFVKSFPALSKGFEIETELTVHALELRMAIAEIRTSYRERAVGSGSKLRTYRDGLRILRTIVKLLKQERPLELFSTIAALLAMSSIAVGARVITEFVSTGLVPRLPSAVLATGLMMVACLAFGIGLVLDSVTHARRELRRLHYLQIASAPRASTRAAHVVRLR